MVELEMDGFTLQVPLKGKMTIREFMNAVERVEVVASANERGLHAKREPAREEMREVRQEDTEPVVHSAPEHAPKPVSNHELKQDDFRFPSEDLVRLQHLANQVRSHMEYIKRHEDTIGRHDKHLNEILEYLQSLDKHLRR